ncbi:MAG: hypothetical protein IKO55_03220 [Kiritimatiellae bacterium]|nr:hypothetical protein [Kiritimatiellia bacterium]
MKQLVITVVTLFCMDISLHAQTNYYSLVTNLWFQGEHTTVFSLATNRLAANTNDIAGWITLAEYSMTFDDASSLSNVLTHTLECGSNITSTAFSELFPIMSDSFCDMLDFVAAYHPTAEEQAEDLRKAHIPGKPFFYSKYLQALETDGYFLNDPPLTQ